MPLLEQLAAKIALAMSGAYGTKVVLPIDDAKIVATTNMKATAYTRAAQPAYPSRITAKTTSEGAADTLGNMVVVGTIADDTVCTESVALVADTTVSTVNEFKTVTSVTTPGWVIGEGNDTIVVGTGATIAGGSLFEADADRIVASADMKVGAYTIAAQPEVPTTLTVTVAATDTADTLGTVTFTGLDTNDKPISETVTPIIGTVTTTKTFKYLFAVTGAGWAVDEAEGNEDLITVGVSAVANASQYYISAINVLAAAEVASQTAIEGATVADLTEFTSIPVGVYPTKLSAISLTSGEAIAYLSTL